MACARLTAAVVAAFAVAAPAHSALAAQKGPQGLRAFTLRASEPVVHTFARTPSFAWNPVRGAKSYQFELSTRSGFGDNSIIWSAKGLKSPATAISVSLPWMTGKPYALYAHARAVTRKGATAWSATFGFNMRWSATPAPMTPSYPGLLRWTPVQGANAYMIWLVDAGKQFTTNTNMADEREYYTFHQNPAFSGAVHWRVRPLRWLYGETENGLPSVSYGPWSPIYTSFNPPFATGPLKDVATVSSVVSDASALRSHSIMPAFIYSGNTSMWNSVEELYRVEVFTDEDCLNTVFRGAMTGAPAYVPRAVGPLAMPLEVSGITAARNNFIATGTEPDSYTFDSLQVKSTESEGSATPPAGAAAKLGLPGANIVGGAPVDLWDSSYYWTVIPIDAIAKDEVDTLLANPALPGDKTITVANGTGIAAGEALRVGSPIGENAVVESVSGNDITLVSGISGSHFTGEDVIRPGGSVTYREAELTQDACASGRVMSFDKSSEPVVTSQKAPFASGLSPNGKLVAAAGKSPRFYGQPLVAWQPAVNADEYEVQWSRSLYPWKTAGSVKTPATSTTLALSPGTWYYRIRGLDPHMAGKKQQMSWSTPVRIVVTKPRFRVVH